MLTARTRKILPGTQALETTTDLAVGMVADIDRHLMGEVSASAERRIATWKPGTNSPEAYENWLGPRRERPRHILGAVYWCERLRNLLPFFLASTS